jgi:hypothetical protein
MSTGTRVSWKNRFSSRDASEKVCKSQDFAGKSSIILRVVPLLISPYVQTLACPDTCADFSRKVLGFTASFLDF